MQSPAVIAACLLLAGCNHGDSLPPSLSGYGAARSIDASLTATPGDGLDDTVAIQAALDSGDNVTFSQRGVYDVGMLTASSDGQSIVIPGGVTLRLCDSVNDPALIVTGSRVSVSGPGSIDGNRSGQSSDCDVVVVTGSACSIDGLSISNAYRYGVYGLGSDGLSLSGMSVGDTGGACVMVEVNGSDLRGIRVIDCDFDRSAAGSLNVMGAVHVHGSIAGGAYRIRDVALLMNRVRLPTASPVASVIGLEAWGNCENVLASSNTVHGGAMAVSLNHTKRAVVSSNLAIGQSLYALEVSDSCDVSVTANVCDGAGAGDFGLALTGNGPLSHRVSVTGNTIAGYDNAGIASYGAASDIVIAGNSIAWSSGVGVYLSSTERFALSGNSLSAAPGNALYGIFLDHAHPGSVTDNTMHGGGYPWLTVYATSGVVDGLTATGNSIHDFLPCAMALSGSASLGLYVTTSPNFWY